MLPPNGLAILLRTTGARKPVGTKSTVHGGRAALWGFLGGFIPAARSPRRYADYGLTSAISAKRLRSGSRKKAIHNS